VQHLRITHPGMAGFNGRLGQIEFKDGVSVEPVSRLHADQIAHSVRVEHIDEDGEHAGHAGVATRLIGGATIPLTVLEPLPVASDADKRAEDAKLASEAASKARRLYSRKELEDIATKLGIEGLRKVAAQWGAKHRKIAELIDLVEKAQDKHRALIAKHDAARQVAANEAREVALAKVAEKEAAITAQARVLTPEPAPVDGTPNAIGEGGENVFVDPSQPKPELKEEPEEAGKGDPSEVVENQG
jgi:hypothetical protein